MRFSLIFLSLTAAAFAAPAGQNRGKQGQGKGQQNNAAAGGAAGNGNGNNATSDDPQTSLTLDPRVIATGFANDGQDQPTEGQVASLTSTNNFINFCLTVPDLPITNGQQIDSGSCNPAPIGVIPSVDNMPSSKFIFPKNGAVLQTGEIFTITMNVRNIELGNFVNAKENYFAAPQQLNDQGQIIGHTHVTIDFLGSIDDTNPTNPKKFAYFKGINTAAENGVASVTVDAGLPAGFYRLASINAAANHQPVIVPIAQHGSLDDMVYFTVADDPSSVPAGFPGEQPAATAATSATPGTSASASSIAPAATGASNNNQASGAAAGSSSNNQAAGSGSNNTSQTGTAVGQGAQTSSGSNGGNGGRGQNGRNRGPFRQGGQQRQGGFNFGGH